VERHHVCGRNHIPFLTIPLCREHHIRLTRAVCSAGVDMRYTPNIHERLRRARQAMWVFQWMLDEYESNFTKGEHQ
jgi:hypothetical protein